MRPTALLCDALFSGSYNLKYRQFFIEGANTVYVHPFKDI